MTAAWMCPHCRDWFEPDDEMGSPPVCDFCKKAGRTAENAPDVTDDLSWPDRITHQGEIVGFDRDGTPIRNYVHLAMFSRDPEYAQICRTELVDIDVMVSTVWLGNPPGWKDFETMIFGGPLDEQTNKYATEESAYYGHAASVLAAMRAGSGD